MNTIRQWLAIIVLALISNTVIAQTTVKYVHTDALGSVVAMTNSSGSVVETAREYEPYGQQLTPAVQDGPGYTGHVQDVATGLTYMQQRYMDPMLGVFLSVDPVTAYSSPVAMFHRYRYANNNPYRFTDPDGRAAILAYPLIIGGRCALSSACRTAVKRGAKAVVATVIALAGSEAINMHSESEPGNESPSPESNEGSGEGEKIGSGTRTPAPFLPDDPYSPESNDRRASERRDAEGSDDLNPDSPMPDRGGSGPGRDQGGHVARGRTPHDAGERNVNRHEEHSRRAKADPTGRRR